MIEVAAGARRGPTRCPCGSCRPVRGAPPRRTARSRPATLAATPGCRADGGRDPGRLRAARRRAPASRAGRCGRRSPVIVVSELADEEQHRRRAAPSPAASTATRSDAFARRAEQPGGREARRRRSRGRPSTMRPSRSSIDAAETGGDVGVVGRDDEREADPLLERVDQLEHRGPSCRCRDARSARRRAAVAASGRARGRSRRAAPRRRRARTAGCSAFAVEPDQRRGARARAVRRRFARPAAHAANATFS